MPNIVLIKHDDMPFAIPAGDIRAVLKLQNQSGEMALCRSMIIHKQRGYALTPVQDTPEDVFEAIQKNLPERFKETYASQTWLQLGALPPFEETEVEVVTPEVLEALPEGMEIETDKPVTRTEYKLPEDLNPQGITYIHSSIFHGYEGFRMRVDPNGQVVNLPEKTAVLKVHIKIVNRHEEQYFAEFCAMTPANLEVLNSFQTN